MSSISAVSGLGNLYDTAQTNSSQANNLFSDFEQLASSLQSGNLSDAQQAYNSLASLLKNAPSNSPAATAFAALGQALQSGNLQSAQQAFSSLQQDVAQGIQGAGGHHHHGGGGGGRLSQLLASTSTDDSADSILNPPSSTTTTVTTSTSDNSQTNNQNSILNVLA